MLCTWQEKTHNTGFTTIILGPVPIELQMESEEGQDNGENNQTCAGDDPNVSFRD